eukprot:XP_001704491.1 Hypothetical protein GL50803_114622 [Giardia lamblia ATCC 50803]
MTMMTHINSDLKLSNRDRWVDVRDFPTVSPDQLKKRMDNTYRMFMASMFPLTKDMYNELA